jgi:fructose-1,6-bisphosphatase/inositol monophosphatase family enzyme
VLADIVDRAAMHGAYFELGSATFALGCVVTGQLDAYVDPAQRMLDECTGVEPDFRAVGLGSLATNFPYDVAAAALVVSESGGVVSDASGRPLDDRPAVGSGPGFGLSVVAASHPALHEALIESLDQGIDRLAAWLRARDHGSGS